jgi:hypothetical protein
LAIGSGWTLYPLIALRSLRSFASTTCKILISLGKTYPTSVLTGPFFKGNSSVLNSMMGDASRSTVLSVFSGLTIASDWPNWTLFPLQSLLAGFARDTFGTSLAALALVALKTTLALVAFLAFLALVPFLALFPLFSRRSAISFLRLNSRNQPCKLQQTLSVTLFNFLYPRKKEGCCLSRLH